MITEVEMGKGGKEGFPGAGVFKDLDFPKMRGGRGVKGRLELDNSKLGSTQQ